MYYLRVKPPTKSLPISRQVLKKYNANWQRSRSGLALLCIEQDELPDFFRNLVQAKMLEVVEEDEALHLLGLRVQLEMPKEAAFAPSAPVRQVKCPHCGELVSVPDEPDDNPSADVDEDDDTNLHLLEAIRGEQTGTDDDDFNPLDPVEGMIPRDK